jgi:hypothetical protein
MSVHKPAPRPPSGVLTGKCLCGAVRYSVQDEFKYALNCHCSNCRRATGSAFKPFAGIERSSCRSTRCSGDIMPAAELGR